MDESKLLYTASHEWVDASNEVCTVGITRYAVDQLTDIVYIELPKVGTRVTAGEPFGVIESVKAVSDLYAPVTGEVVAVNTALVDDPAILNKDPYDKGWMVKIRVGQTVTLTRMKDKAAYEQQIAAGGK